MAARPDSPAVVTVSARAFSLADGGPYLALMRRTGLAGPELEGTGRRAAVLVAIAWLPLFVLALLDGRAWDGVAVPLVRDADLAARLLVALPLFVFAEAVLHRRFPLSFARFASRGLVVPAQRERFEAIVADARRWIGAPWVEAVLVAIVVASAVFGVGRSVSGLGVETWYVGQATGAPVLRPAGAWLVAVSLPLFQFLLLRWGVRLAAWWILLVRISRLELQLQPLHPDKAGGIGFLAQLSLAFAPFAVALGAMASGWIANQIFHKGAQLLQFKLDLAAATAIVVFVLAGPLLAFAPALDRARRGGLGRYGNLAMQYAAEFDRKWLRAGHPPDEGPLGSGDIQSLADLGNSYGTLQDMRVVPFSAATLTRLGVFVLAPVAPLLLTMVSVEELLKRLVQMVL
jgi:hypothetical protein